ncbi:MAG: GNAT family N-acetyltransferase [Oscillospiraceae bacterium]|jgi:predicted N-acetyltransferase YhbS|nr:GNAT family N-acetyltransferase [Oscillospiraceae bacterium]
MAVYETARFEDRAEILDFANLVFSMAHVPHDFARMLPKVYGENAPLFRPDMHFVSREDGHIRAMVAMLPVPIKVAGRAFTIGYIGTVSSHPYYRGHGGMKALMNMAIDTARREGYACLALGGRRQRYGYFGFTPAGMKARHSVIGDNIRHALGGVDASGISFKTIIDNDDPLIDGMFGLYDRQAVTGSRSKENFLIICQSWGAELAAVMDGGECVGYAVARNDGVSELVLIDPVRYAKPFIKAWHSVKGDFKLEIPVYDAALQREVVGFCERLELTDEMKLHVIDWETTVGATLALKRLTHPMPDGRWTIQVESDSPLTLEVAGRGTSVGRDNRDADVNMTRTQAQTALFSRESLLLPTVNAPQGWFPLSFGMRNADDF